LEASPESIAAFNSVSAEPPLALLAEDVTSPLECLRPDGLCKPGQDLILDSSGDAELHQQFRQTKCRLHRTTRR
jgi:hypothetical protein